MTGDHRYESPLRQQVTLELQLPSISVIIAAYNEQAWIAETLSSLVTSGFPCEMIVVDDGSTDGTPAILNEFRDRVRVVTHATNRGKGAAIVTGLGETSGDIVVFCDAHLRGLNRYHLLTLVTPLLDGTAREVLGIDLPSGRSIVHVASPFQPLTGQRAYFREDLLPLCTQIEDLGYGLETFLFSRFDRTQRAFVLLPGLEHLMKKDTSTIPVACRTYLRETIEVLKTLVRIKSLVLIEPVRQRVELAASLSKHLGRRASKRRSM
jgi:glycosyltransferase involved in cell wall biosynthesis